MALWLIPLILLALLSPLLWLLPAKRQGQRMQLRLQARRMGLGMQLVFESWPHWLSDAPTPCAQYHAPRAQPDGENWCYWQLNGEWLNQWREPCKDSQLLLLFTKLPPDVYKIEANAEKVAVYWGERGGLQALEVIAAALKSLGIKEG